MSDSCNLVNRFVHDRQRRIGVQLGAATPAAGAPDRVVVVAVGSRRDRGLVESSTNGERWRRDIREDGARRHRSLHRYRNLLWRRWLLLYDCWSSRCRCNGGFHFLFLLFEELFQLQEVTQPELLMFDVLPLKQKL